MHLIAIVLLAAAVFFFLLGGWRLVAWMFVLGVFSFMFLLYLESQREMAATPAVQSSATAPSKR
jgi:hypothetical protein